MSRFALSCKSDPTLLRDLHALVARERAATAEVVAHIAEVDARRLYLPAAYPSMYAWCVGELHMSEDAAYKRIQAARVARRFPDLLDALADGRLHLTGVGLLAPHLTEATAAGLLAAAAHRTKAEIERLLAERFPRPDLPVRLEALPATGAVPAPCQLAPAQVGRPEPVVPGPVAAPVACQLAPAQVGWPEPVVPGPVVPGPAGGPAAPVQEPGRYHPVTQPGACQLAPAQVAARARVTPLSPERYGLQVTLDEPTHAKLRHAAELLSHRVPAGDLAQVLALVLDAAIPELEKRKFAATARPRRTPRGSGKDSRHIPADVRRDVWKRDQGRCTFMSDSGRRCERRTGLQFDHVQAYARGGEATVSGIRLRCRAHNQYEAERTFGPEFMRHKRLAAAAARAQGKVQPAAAAGDHAP